LEIHRSLKQQNRNIDSADNQMEKCGDLSYKTNTAFKTVNVSVSLKIQSKVRETWFLVIIYSLFEIALQRTNVILLK